jgi:hypothetical protein
MDEIYTSTKKNLDFYLARFGMIQRKFGAIMARFS